MKYNEYSHRHGKELLQVLHPDLVKEIQVILTGLQPYPHGSKKGTTVKDYITDAFVAKGWTKEVGPISKMVSFSYNNLFLLKECFNV